MYPIFVVLLDGLADRAHDSLGGRTANESAATPNLDRLAAQGSCGLMFSLGPGRAPASELALSAPAVDSRGGVTLGGEAVSGSGRWQAPTRLPELPVNSGMVELHLAPATAVPAPAWDPATVFRHVAATSGPLPGVRSAAMNGATISRLSRYTG